MPRLEPQTSMAFDRPSAPHAAAPWELGLARGARIVVAMSGGVDSSLTAALLKRRGYDVIGLTLQLYDQGASESRSKTCCAGQDIHDARKVAAQLGIPHYVLDYEARFKAAVIDPFADSYVAGETPVPCIACNQTVKFADLLAAAQDLGADALATGHYVQIDRSQGYPVLRRGVDPSRDQSYFLFATTEEQLAFLRFPLGDTPKSSVRQMAEDWMLPVAAKPDSQDICFVPNGRYADIVARLRPEASTPGEIVHVDGRVLGRHDGILRFTVGQRRGLNVAAGEPLFVVRIDPSTNTVVVGPRECLRTTQLALRSANWLAGPDGKIEDGGTYEVFVRIRSTHTPTPATVTRRGQAAEVSLHMSEFGVSPGQACVFYDSDRPEAAILGGGWIAATKRNEAA